MIGQTISHYTILEKLGEGGMGVVYKAHDTTLNREVAIKFLPPHISKAGTERERFLQEAQAAAAINHPNICVIHEINEDAEQPYIVMEYVDGSTIRTKLENGPFKIDDAIKYGIQIGEALQEAHSKGIVHYQFQGTGKSDGFWIGKTERLTETDPHFQYGRHSWIYGSRTDTGRRGRLTK
jgi:aminoglycoside phosphotransferase (APT) family kinase protein